MGLHVENIAFVDFRNYCRLSLSDLSATTVFTGPNATGKTNVLEGIQLLTAHASLRGAHAKELVRTGADFARLSAHFSSDVREVDVAAVIQPGSRSYSLNGKKRSVGDLQGLLPAVSFSPEDLDLVRGGQARRRATLDALGFQLSKNHRIIHRDYEKLVRHKNALLKDEASDAFIDAVDDALIPVAAQLYLYRAALMRRIDGRVSDLYADIANVAEHASVSYVASWDVAAEEAGRPLSTSEGPLEKEQVIALLTEGMKTRRAEERARKRAVVGPHGDHVDFFIDGRRAAEFASQGQQRSLVLAWKMAEVSLIEDMLGVAPVLLLDDVMSELDARRRSALFSLLDGKRQTFITATDVVGFSADMLKSIDVIDLSGRGQRA